MKRTLLYVAVACLACAVPATATTVLALSNAALTSQADVIAIGQALESQSAWENRQLVTRVTVRVTERLKGEAGDTIVVTLPGGIDTARKHPIAMSYPGAPTLHRDEQVFLFLDRDDADPSRLTVVGFSQGKFSINRDADGTQVVDRDLSAVTLSTSVGLVPGRRNRVPLAQFRREITEYLSGR